MRFRKIYIDQITFYDIFLDGRKEGHHGPVDQGEHEGDDIAFDLDVLDRRIGRDDSQRICVA